MLGRSKIEDYLKTICRLQRSETAVRSTDIASELHVTRPTVCVAVKELKQRGYITISADNSISLTPEGEKIAVSVTEKYFFFLKILRSLHVAEETAEHDACKLEHILSDESFYALKKYFESTTAAEI